MLFLKENTHCARERDTEQNGAKYFTVARAQSKLSSGVHKDLVFYEVLKRSTGEWKNFSLFQKHEGG